MFNSSSDIQVGSIIRAKINGIVFRSLVLDCLEDSEVFPSLQEVPLYYL